jgi:hypothetical protein
MNKHRNRMLSRCVHPASILALMVIISCTTLARSQSLDFQAMCATQSRKAFQEYENEWKTGVGANMYRTIGSDYQSHYNTKLKKCLLLIEATRMLGGESMTSAYLSDAYERRPYANYMWMSRKDKKYWEVPPTECELVPSMRNKRNCTSREEFDAFVAEYMEE